jgi:hypothetical protein
VAAADIGSGVPSAEVYDPVAAAGGIVLTGRARFTLLTSRLIRMEWSPDGAFEDRASLVFLHRRLPVPPHLARPVAGGGVSIRTKDLALDYVPHGDGRFDAQSLRVTLNVGDRVVTWYPGADASGNLGGSVRSLDLADGAHLEEPVESGLVSRDGWSVVDDSERYLFDSTDFSFAGGLDSPWPWVTARPPGDRQDLYFFGYGHDYYGALGDYVRVAGRVPLPPRHVFGIWWSRYWVYSDQEILDLADRFRDYGVPLDVFVIDLEWHPAMHQRWLAGELDESGRGVGFGGCTWNALLFHDVRAFLAEGRRLSDQRVWIPLRLRAPSPPAGHRCELVLQGPDDGLDALAEPRAVRSGECPGRRSRWLPKGQACVRTPILDTLRLPCTHPAQRAAEHASRQPRNAINDLALASGDNVSVRQHETTVRQTMEPGKPAPLHRGAARLVGMDHARD